MIVECPSRVAGMRKQSAGASGGAGGRGGASRPADRHRRQRTRAAVRSRLTKKCVQLVCMRDHYFGYILMDNIAATKVPPVLSRSPPRAGAHVHPDMTAMRPKWPYSLSNSHAQHPARADTCAENTATTTLVELDLVLAVGDRVHVHRDEDEAANDDGEDGRDVKRHRLGGEGVARLLLQRLERNLLLLDPASGNMGARCVSPPRPHTRPEKTLH